MAFQDNQIIQTSIPMEQPNQATSGIIQSLPASQSLNALRGRWMGSTNAANRPPVTEQRQGRGGRPPVFTPEARPRQERTAQAAQQHRTGYLLGPSNEVRELLTSLMCLHKVDVIVEATNG